MKHYISRTNELRKIQLAITSHRAVLGKYPVKCKEREISEKAIEELEHQYISLSING